MAKSVCNVLNSAKVFLLAAFLMTAFFIIHIANNSSIFHPKHQTAEGINNIKKQNQLDKSPFNAPKGTDPKKGIPYTDTSNRNNNPNFSNNLSKPTPVLHKVQSKNTAIEPQIGHEMGHEFQAPPNPTKHVLKVKENVNVTGFKNHPILYYSDVEYSTLKISEMMKFYGESDGGGSCAKDFGNELVNRWRNAKKNVCGANQAAKTVANARNQKLNTEINCYFIQQTRHHGAGDQICVYNNVVVNLALFNDEQLTTSVVEKYVRTNHNAQPYIPFPKDFIQGDCNPLDPAAVSDMWRSLAQPGWNNDLTVNGFTHNADINTNECDVWIDHPVVIQQRDTFANFFHDSEDFVNVFLTLAILEYKMEDMQLMLTDLYPEGPFWDMWSRVYSDKYAAMTSWDIKQAYKNVGVTKENNKKNKVCFKQLAIGIYGPAAPITVASWDTSCRRTALVRSYSDFVIRGLELQTKTHYALPEPSDTIVVTYMSRRPSKEWPERKYCNSTGSFFLCKLWDGFGARSLGRMIRNDADVVKALKSLEDTRDYISTDPSKSGRRRKVVVQDVDYNVLSFQQQIEIDLQTDIMIGPHGAGLMHNIFMRDRATLIELFVDGSGVNRHFHNLAFWFGRNYEGININNPINCNELLNIVKRAILNIDIDVY